MILRNISKNILFTICGSFLLCISFGLDETMVNGLITGKMLWLCGWGAALILSYLLVELKERQTELRLTLPDLLVGLLLATVLLTYNWQVNPNPNTLIFTVQILLLWFFFRLIIRKAPRFVYFAIPVLFLTAIIQSLWGLVQIYNLADSNHALFSLTGFFPNPGPYSGYLAFILPVAVGYMLHVRKRTHSPNRDYKRLYYFSAVTIVFIIMVLPAGMSRSAWLAAILSSGWVVWKYKMGIRKFRLYRKRKPLLLGSVILGSLLLLGIAAGVLYHLKKDSADGRVLMWKITVHTFLEHPVRGTGIGGFPAAFAKAQADYLESGKATPQEKLVAGTPEYAFNEYLQIATELGLFGFLFFVAFILTVIRTGIRKKRYYAVGGILSLLIFAFSSYPFRDPSFWPAFLLLCTTCVMDLRIYKREYQRFIPYIGMALSILFLILCGYQGYRLIQYRQWKEVKVFYNNKAYEIAIEKYTPLYPYLNHDPAYLFEYAQAFGESRQHADAIKHLERASLLSSDPMIHCMIGKNQMKNGRFNEAEQCYREALRILPERIYPYFLMTELYSHPDNYQEDKFRMACDSVLYKTPKVESIAIREMREKVNKLLKKQAADK